MRLGIFAKIFVRPTLAETLDAVVAHGLDCVQFNFACAGLPTLPEKISSDLMGKISAELRKRKLSVPAVSGTFNLIDPDKSRREASFHGLRELAANCAGLGASIITLCSGTRDPDDMWRRHPDNDSPEAWREMLQSMAAALEIADKYKIFLGIEPETANVISSAKKARQLLDEMKSPRLKIVMDASNLFHPGDGAKAEDILHEAFDLLGRDVGLAHAKDYRDTGKMEFVPPGKGDLPWAQYFRLLRTSGFGGPLIMHSLAETEVDGSVSFLRKKMMESEKPKRLPIATTFDYDEIEFNYQDVGRGIPFFYQHGLTGSVEQTFGVFNPPAGFRMISFDCRCHGETRPAGPDEKIGISSFADDLLALMNHLKIGRAIVGGISMGSALSLNFALRHPNRVRALILQRPAWLDGLPRENVEVFATMAKLIRQHGAVKGLEIFKETPTYQSILKDSPTAADSLVGYFQHPRAEETVAILERIPVDTPHPDRAKWRAINVPTLALANKQDPIHPFEFGEVLAREIPGAEFRELTPKSVSLERHNEEVQQFIEDFFAPPLLTQPTAVFMLKCSTSLWSADLSKLAEEMKRVEPFSERFHLDVADGHYVKSLLFFPDLVKALRPHSKLPFEVHLMVSDPMGWIDPFVEAGADIIIFCFDSARDPGQALRAIRSHGKKAGVSMLLTESVQQLEPHWKDLDIVTFCGTAMGIKGANMDPACLEKTREARAIISSRSLPVEIESDGGIRRETVPLLKAAGTDYIVPGSLIFKEDPKQMRQWLAKL